MGADLPVDKLEAAFGIGDLFPQTGGQLGQQVAMLTCSGLCIKMQLGELSSQQRISFRIERSDISLCMLNLPRDAKQFRSLAFANDRGIDLTVIVQQPLQCLRVAALISLVRKRHQQCEVALLVIVPREVRMNPLGHLAKQSLEAWRWIKLLRLMGRAKRGIVCLLRLPAALLGPPASYVRVIQRNLSLGDPRLKIVELRIENANLAKIMPLKCRKLGPHLRQLRFTLCKRRANSRKPLALGRKNGGVRGWLKYDLGGHEPLVYRSS